MNQLHVSGVKERADLKAKFEIGTVFITQGFNNHHALKDNLIGVVVHHEVNSYLRQLGVSICFSNFHYEEFYEDELEVNFKPTGLKIASVETLDLKSDGKIDAYVKSVSFAQSMENVIAQLTSDA